MTNKNTRRGFTLMELLVVVLIIGILAAGALPQYQKAVRKTKYRAMLPILSEIVKAQNLYYTANGNYATQFNDLDLGFKGEICSNNLGCGTTNCISHTHDCVEVGEYSVRLMKDPVDSILIGFTKAVGHSERGTSGYQYLFKAAWNVPPGYHCREGGYYPDTNRRDFHCTGELIKNNWYGSWFKMEDNSFHS